MNIDPGIILHEISNAGTIIQNGLDAEEQAPSEQTAKTARRITRMGLSRLIASITTLKILVAHQPPNTETSGNLAEHLKGLIQDRNLWGDRGPLIRFTHDDQIEQCGVPLVETAVRNLIANALRFSPKSQPIQVRLKHTKTQTWISILNYGPELEPYVRANLFSPGCKGTHGGSGLGLHIAQRCANTLRGRIAVYSKAPITVFSLIFPDRKSVV